MHIKISIGISRQRIGCEKSEQLEFVPVVDDGHVLGLVPVTAIFQAAAALALTPEDEGIRFDQE